MSTNASSKKEDEKRPPIVADSPITIGGGGGMVPDKVKIKFKHTKFNDDGQGTYELKDGAKAIYRIEVYLSKNLVLDLPVSGEVEVKVHYDS